jgi:hypothetical protein
VLARGERGLDDLAVQRVGDGYRDGVDVGRVDDGAPVGGGALEAVPPRGVDRERLVRVGDGDEPDRG